MKSLTDSPRDTTNRVSSPLKTLTRLDLRYPTIHVPSVIPPGPHICSLIYISTLSGAKKDIKQGLGFLKNYQYLRTHIFNIFLRPSLQQNAH
jgi:hypothetical protein